MSDTLPEIGPVQNDRIARALELVEDERLDFKRVRNVDSILKAACAMANTRGGWLVLGIDDARRSQGRDRVYGVDEAPESVGEVKRSLIQRISPSLCPPHVQAVTESGIRCTLRDGRVGTVSVLYIPQSNSVHSLVDGGTYVRFGATSRQLSATEITELSLRRGVQSAVDATVDVPVELLNTEWYRQYSSSRRLSRPIQEQLRHLGLCRRAEGDDWRPTRACVLLFAENPGGLLQQKCSVRIFQYRGHRIEHTQDTNLLLPPITVDGPVLKQIREATDIVVRLLASGVQVSTAGLQIRQKYPVRVIQEAITNAVIHRDYRLSQDIHIRLFANRIEVESPGTFPGAVTAENVKDVGSHPRNRAIVDHLREFPSPPNLDAGEGVRMMYQTLEATGLYPPRYQADDDIGREVVTVILLNEARQSEWLLIEDYLRQHSTIRNSDLRLVLNCASHVKASKMLHGWVDKGLLVVANPDQGKRVREYRLKPVSGSTEAADRLFSDAGGKQTR